MLWVGLSRESLKRVRRDMRRVFVLEATVRHVLVNYLWKQDPAEDVMLDRT